MNLTKRYYDQGWNAYLRGDSFDETAFRDWQEGWLDSRLASMHTLEGI